MPVFFLSAFRGCVFFLTTGIWAFFHGLFLYAAPPKPCQSLPSISPSYPSPRGGLKDPTPCLPPYSLPSPLGLGPPRVFTGVLKNPFLHFELPARAPCGIAPIMAVLAAVFSVFLFEFFTPASRPRWQLSLAPNPSSSVGFFACCAAASACPLMPVFEFLKLPSFVWCGVVLSYPFLFVAVFAPHFL